MYFGMGAEATVTLQDFSFARIPTASVSTGVLAITGYNATERPIRFGDLPPVVFSEVCADLARLAGQSAAGEEAGEG